MEKNHEKYDFMGRLYTKRVGKKLLGGVKTVDLKSMDLQLSIELQNLNLAQEKAEGPYFSNQKFLTPPKNFYPPLFGSTHKIFF